MQTPSGVTPSMVAAGSEKTPGPLVVYPNSLGFGAQVEMKVKWQPRGGRNNLFALWDDAFGDALALLNVKRAALDELPPERPTGAALNGASYALWKNATDDFQAENTAIFDAVRPSLDLDGPHCAMDLHRIKQWKRDGIKDGRALVRWVFTFVDQSTIEGQMKLVTDINGMSLSAAGTLLNLSEHLYNLWEMWLALFSSDRNLPNSRSSVSCCSPCRLRRSAQSFTFAGSWSTFSTVANPSCSPTSTVTTACSSK